MSDEPWTVGRLLTWTADWLAGKGSDSPRLDAEVLLAHVRGCQRILLYATFDEVVADEPRGRFRELVRRRAAGEPVAYLVGNREFFSLSFAVSPAVLVPRPETEGLVVRAIDLCKPIAAPRILDVGTGSGAIAVTLARQLPGGTVVASDISAAALAVAACMRNNPTKSKKTAKIRKKLRDHILPVKRPQSQSNLFKEINFFFFVSK